MTENAAQEARDPSRMELVGQASDGGASPSKGAWRLAVSSPSRICNALLKAAASAGVIASVQNLTDASVVDPKKRDRLALGDCDAIIISGAYDAARARVFAASALRSPTLFIADQDEHAHENDALAAGAHTAMLARDCTPSSLRSALQNAQVAFNL